jgi:hypothetical protein
VITYRGAQRWLVYLAAATMLVSVLEAFAGVERHIEGAAEWFVLITLTATGAAIPLGLLLWSRSVGIRLSDAGIVSVSFSSADAIRWREVSRFFVDDRGPHRLAVYAGLSDGSRVALYSLQGWRWERDWLERVCDGLIARLHHEHSRAAQQPALPANFMISRFAWRLRVREADTRIRATA